MRRRSAAQRVSSCRLESWSLRRTAETWLSTVFTERCSRAGDLLVAVAARDQLQHLALARGERVELGVDRRLARAEGVEHEAGEPRREDGVALGDAVDGVGELLAEIVFVT